MVPVLWRKRHKLFNLTLPISKTRASAWWLEHLGRGSKVLAMDLSHGDGSAS